MLIAKRIKFQVLYLKYEVGLSVCRIWCIIYVWGMGGLVHAAKCFSCVYHGYAGHAGANNSIYACGTYSSIKLTTLANNDIGG